MSRSGSPRVAKAEWDESKHPRDKGKFARAEGEGSEAHRRAAEAMKDRAFLGPHRDRIMEAASTARSAFPRQLQASDHATPAAHEAINAAVQRIQREADGETPSPEGERAESLEIGARHYQEHSAREDERAAAEQAASEGAVFAAAQEEEQAGRLLPLPAKMTDAIATADKALDDLETAKDQAVDALDTSGAAAISAVSAMEKLASEDYDIGQGDAPTAQEIAEAHRDVTDADLAVDAVDRYSGSDFDPFQHAPGDNDNDEEILEGYEELDEPDEKVFEDEADYEQAVADHPAEAKAYADRFAHVHAALDARAKAHMDAAQQARDALAAHLAVQDKAVADLTKTSEAHEGAKTEAEDQLNEFDFNSSINKDHFAKFELGESGEFGDFEDGDVQEEYDDAARIAEERHSILATRLDEKHGSPLEMPSGDLLDLLDEYQKRTKGWIRQLDKILKPKKPKKTKASKSFGPDDDHTANLAGVSTHTEDEDRKTKKSAGAAQGLARYKLKLSKLDFISLVDTPAQQTASVRLIKRAGARDSVQANAVARVVKIGEGDNPLVYCWAFTCTGEDGQPYHDLQGDAIEPDAFIKAAEEFMRSGAAVDEMHDGKQTSRVAFAFPMDSDIASAMLGKAVGSQVKTIGLMVAIRPAAEALAKLRSGAYTGVSIAGLGTRQVVKARPKKPKRAMARAYKRIVMTSEEDGHAHTIDLCEPERAWGTLQTSYATADGADATHTHGWVYDEAGKITLTPDSGHTHTVDAAVPAEVMAEAAEDEDEDDEDRCAAQEAGAGAAVVVVRAGLSTPAGAAPTVKGTSQENPTMDPKFAKMLTAALLLPDDQRAYAARLAPDEQQAFVGFDAATRESAMAAGLALDPVVYTTKSGTAIRKSHGSLAEIQAKQIDAQADRLAAQDIELSISKAKADQIDLEKRAAEVIPLIGDSLEVRVALLKSAAAITDATLRDGVIRALKGAQAAFALLAKAQGYSSAGEGQSPQAAWESGLSDFAKAKSIENPLDAIVPFLKTEHGKALKKNLDAIRPNAQPS